MSEDGSEIKRLVLAKSLYLHGCTHATNKDNVSRMVAIHHFDNAVEIVLRCVTTRQGVKSKKKQLYFEELLQANDDLPLKEQMRGLHRARNAVQHQGDVPSMESVVKYKGYTEDFFRQVCKAIFSVRYEELFLSELIDNENLREQVRKAEEVLGKGEFERCLELCDEAFMSAIFEEADIFYKAGALTRYWGASEELKTILEKDYPEKFRDKEYYNLAKELCGAIKQWGQATTGMQFLDEYRVDFIKYRQIVESREEFTEEKLKDHAQFCLNFVTSVVLKWQAEGLFGLKDSEHV